MNVRYLTPSEKDLWDPDGNIRQLVAARPVKSSYAAPSVYVKFKPDEMLGRYEEMLSSSERAMPKHGEYFKYNRSLFSKFGPQGGTFQRQQMMELLKPYFEKALRPVQVTSILEAGRDYLVALIRDRRQKVGGPAYTLPDYRQTYAGSPTGLHKGDLIAETVGAKPYRHAYPTVMGQRRMRSKDRLIFMDSVLNVRIMESWLAPVRNWLKTYIPEYFGSWLNPCKEVHPRTQLITENNSIIIESDYQQMDASFSYDVVDKVVLPVYREVLLEQWTPFLEAHLIECFHQPVFGVDPDTIIEGKHNLFSGIGCTNDFETIYTIALAIGVCLYYGCLPNADILALGDDMRIGIRRTTERFGSYWLDTFREVSDLAGLYVHDLESGKSWVGKQSCRYLRRVYYPAAKWDSCGNKPGAYPSVLVLNNIVQPEYPSASSGMAALADLQRLDNMTTNPEYNAFLGFMRKTLTHNFIFSPEDESRRKSDWWEKLYGERWDPTSSYSYQCLRKHFNLK
jgi:hypothetical protein